MRFFFSVHGFFFGVYSNLGILVWILGFFFFFNVHLSLLKFFIVKCMDLCFFPQECENECENLFPVFVSLSFVLSS